MKRTPWIVAVFMIGLGCGDEVATPESDAVDAAAPDSRVPVPTSAFSFTHEPGQALSAGPFPSNLLLEETGLVHLGPLEADPRLSSAGSSALLEAYNQYVAERSGFGVGSPVWFFMNEAPDLSTFDEHVEIITLAGPEAGKRVPVELFYNERIGALGLFPAFGHYLMADSTYAAIIRRGVKTQAGEVIEPPAAFGWALGLSAPSDESLDLTFAQAAYAPLRSWLDENSDEELVIGTVFTTEPVLDYFRALLAGVDAFELEKPSRVVGYHPETSEPIEVPVLSGQEVLEAYFGTPTAPFEYSPGVWKGRRGGTEHMPDFAQRYEGGTGHFGFEAVIHGSIVTPAFNYAESNAGLVSSRLRFEAGAAVSDDIQVQVPFVLYLCTGQLAAPADLPVMMFAHGGGATNRIASTPVANANCLNGVATIAIDMPFHGGRLKTTWMPEMRLLAATTTDEKNDFNDIDGEPDYLGDTTSSAQSVGPLFAIEYDLDPLLIEANLLTISTDNYTLLRLLREGDWSDVLPGLSFDADRLFHGSLSFGTTFSTNLIATIDHFKGVIGSVGTAYTLPVNMPMAPGNAVMASGLLFVSLGLEMPPLELQEGSYRDVMVGLHAWLSGRGDSLPYAPYVLRHRPSEALPEILASGNTWDETLFGPAQLTYSNAVGYVTYSVGDEWTLGTDMPGSETIESIALPEEGVSGSFVQGDRTTSAAMVYSKRTCHAQLISPTCGAYYVRNYPPVVPLEPADYSASASAVCGLHGQIARFVGSLLEGAEHGLVTAPTDSCEELYGSGTTN